MSVYRVDRPAATGTDTEYYPTQHAAQARERQLRLAGVNWVVWWLDMESTGPFVQLEEGAA